MLFPNLGVGFFIPDVTIFFMMNAFEDTLQRVQNPFCEIEKSLHTLGQYATHDEINSEIIKIQKAVAEIGKILKSNLI